MLPWAIVQEFFSNSISPFSISPSRAPSNSMKFAVPPRPGRKTPFLKETFIASPDCGCDAVSKETNGLRFIGRPSNAVTTISLIRTSRTRSMKVGPGVGAGPGGGVASGAGVAAGAGVAFFPPRISPFKTDGMSVRNSILRTAERAVSCHSGITLCIRSLTTPK